MHSCHLNIKLELKLFVWGCIIYYLHVVLFALLLTAQCPTGSWELDKTVKFRCCVLVPQLLLLTEAHMNSFKVEGCLMQFHLGLLTDNIVQMCKCMIAFFSVWFCPVVNSEEIGFFFFGFFLSLFIFSKGRQVDMIFLHEICFRRNASCLQDGRVWTHWTWWQSIACFLRKT